MTDHRHVFGPVPSRRLGRSLGVDLVPHKTCTYDCIYCQLGRTACKTLQRKEWVATDELLAELKEALQRTEPDWVTLSGSGEPTLHAHLGRIVDRIRAMTTVPLAVLTNGSLLWMPEVRDAIEAADLVMPTLAAGSDAMFKQVNRPHDELSLEKVVDGIAQFRERFKGNLWLEVFLVAGLSATEAEVPQMIRLAERVHPDRIQLNTVARPPSESYAFPVPEQQMLRYAARFGRNAAVIADYQGTRDMPEFAAKRDDVLGLLSHRPCTIEDIAQGLGMHRHEVLKHIEDLMDEAKITTKEQHGKTYYLRA